MKEQGDRRRLEPPTVMSTGLSIVQNTGLLKIIVGFFNLIEQHSKFLVHTLQVLYMCTLCDSTNIKSSSFQTVCSMSAVMVSMAVRRHLSKVRSKRRNA